MSKPISSRSSALPSIIEARESFQTYGSLRGDWELFRPTVGQLPREYRELLNEAYDDQYKVNKAAGMIDKPIYVVYSYQTPIAWYTPNAGWVIPPVKYSVTTSKHQGRLYLAKNN